MLLSLVSFSRADARPNGSRKGPPLSSQRLYAGKSKGQRGLQQFQFPTISGDPFDITITLQMSDGKGKGKSKKSQRPSEAPSVSPAPTYSVSPSAMPSHSQRPSAHPSARPTVSPTLNPTNAPTSFAPTTGPTASVQPTPVPFETVALVTTDGDVERLSECSNPVPNNANPVDDAVLNFQYNMYITQSLDPAQSVAAVESRLHPLLATPFLDCQFDGDTPFEVRAISSLPVDAQLERCALEDELSGSDCWIINAGVTVQVFDFQRRRRFLQEWWFTNVTSAFGAFLTSLFRGSELIVPGENIVSLKFVGFTDGIVGETFDANNNAEPLDFGALNQGIDESTGDDNKNLILSSILVGFAAVCLIVVGALVARRRNGKNSRAVGDLVGLEDDLSDDDSIYWRKGQSGRRNIPEQPLDKVMVLSDMEAYEDNRSSGGYDIDPKWSPRSYSSDNFNPPTFVPTSNMKSSVRGLRGPPNGYSSRAYVSADTVDL